MSIEQQIPGLSDEELEKIYINAMQLAQSGSEPERAQAEELLPRLGEAINQRRAAQRQGEDEKRSVSAQENASVMRAARTYDDH